MCPILKKFYFYLEKCIFRTGFYWTGLLNAGGSFILEYYGQKIGWCYTPNFLRHKNSKNENKEN